VSHERKVCEHGTVISQCRCIHYGGKPVVVVRPCPFGDAHLGMPIRHPEPPTGGASEGAQLPAGAAESPGAVSQDPLWAPAASQRVLCPSVMAIRDRAALGEFQCTEDPGHETDHRSGPSGVSWPRLEQRFGEPITGRRRG